MSASEAAAHVLDWAIDGGDGPPPPGDFQAIDALAEPSPALHERVGVLAARSLARLRLVAPPLGDARPPGTEVAVLALAVGLARMAAPLAAHVLGLVGPAHAAWEQVVRHGLVAPALAHVPEALADSLRERSPLTELLERPAAGGEDEALARLVALARLPGGRRLVVQALARPTDDLAVLGWRAGVLDRLRVHDDTRAWVVEAYEEVLTHHRALALERVERATATLMDALAATDAAIARVHALARFWGPLWALRRSHADVIRARRALDIEGVLAAGRFYDLVRRDLEVTTS